MTVQIDLDGHTAIVTGGGRGIGEAIAKTFGKAGADVVVAARTASEIDATAESIRTLGGDALAVPTDLRDRSDITELVDRAEDRFGTPTILVNNAGVNISRPATEYAADEIDTMIDVNLRGLFVLSQRFGQQFRRGEPATSGRIINISSIYARLGVPTKTVYTGTKSGIHGLTRGLAADYSRDVITVNSVTPGRVRIQRVEEVMDDDDEGFDVDRIPLGRLGEPEDIANACLFLASPLAEYITGEDICVDGGTAFTAGPYQSVPD